ncbi:hypothetical protein CA951_38095 [Rhodococcus sp. NCIMB 12038]|nr:hypothetical protein CA951_38095 [Rhodococcus sp. NCIMB 12038]
MRARRALRREIMQVALELFVAKGFDAVTVDEIAGAADMSKRTFFRYFASKEDLVVDNLVEVGHELAHRLAAQPSDLAAWPALRAAFDLIVEHNDGAPERTLILLTMLHETSALRARHLEKQSRWQELLAPDLLERMTSDVPEALRAPAAKALAGAALACLDTAQEVWCEAGGRISLGPILDGLMDAVHSCHTA